MINKIKNQDQLQIDKQKEMHTIFYGVIMHFLKRIMKNHKNFFKLVERFDIFLSRLLKSHLVFFKPSEIMLIVKKRDDL